MAHSRDMASKITALKHLNRRTYLILAISAFLIVALVFSAFAADTSTSNVVQLTDGASQVSGNAALGSDGVQFGTNTTATTPNTSPPTTQAPGTTAPGNPAPSSNYQANLAKILASPYRNKLEDGSKFLNTPSANLPLNELYGPRTDYNGEISNLDPNGIGKGIGIFRATCSFSHFAYDDPIVFPNQPEVAHLHMFWGNTNSNAFTTYNTLINSGGSSCNGHELNRTSYWMPAIIDGNYNVRLPWYLKVYYKSYGGSVGQTQYYPDNLQLVANAADFSSGETMGFSCNGGSLSTTMPNCNGNIEMNVRFRNCWNGQDPSKYKDNFAVASYSWYSGVCPSNFPLHIQNIEYLIQFHTTGDSSSWFLSSDVNKASGTIQGTRGQTIHGDWYGGWNKEVNKLWVDRCNNVSSTDCETGYLGGRLPSETQYPALKFHDNYSSNGIDSYPGKELFKAICTNTAKSITKPTDLAYCR